MEHNEMLARRFPLDEGTADRLAAGELHPHDAPPGYAAVAAVLSSAQADLVPTEIDQALLGSMVRAITTSSSTPTVRTQTMLSKLLSAKIATIAAAAVLTSAGAAAAATGNLPAPAQDAVAEAASHVGFDLPASGDDHPTGNGDNPTEADAHGAEVSETARTTESTGADKGAEVSETARAGHGPDDAVDDDATEDTHGKPADPGSQAPVATPNEGGTGTASDASDATSDVGTDHAPEQADAGSDNADADDHPTADDNPGSDHRP